MKKKEIIRKKKNSFREVFRTKKMVVIGELKIASPTEQYIGKKEDIFLKAKEYENASIDALSIITEKHFFQGDISFIPHAKQVVDMPILQKDFVIDVLQIYEAKGLGSSAILLIARIVDGRTLQRFVELAYEIGIEPVVEIADEDDLEKAIKTNTYFMAINARDLDTFSVNVKKACFLMEKIPERFIRLGFSGIKGREEVEQYRQAGAKGILVGTSLMRAKDVKEFIRELRII